MAHIRKRGKKYTVIIELEKDEEGKRKQKTIGSYGTKKKAQEVLLSTENARLNNTFIEENKMLFNDYTKKYLEEVVAALAKSTQVDYEIIYNNYTKDYFKNMKLQTISVTVIQDYFNNYIKHLSPQTIRKHYALLNGIFTKAFKSELISKNLCDYVTLPKVKAMKTERLELEEIKLLLEKSKETRFEIQINLAINLGLRLGEILGLKWKDIDFTKCTVDINKTFNIIRQELIFKEPKTENSNRTLIANKEVMQMLKEEYLKQKEQRLKEKSFNEMDLVCVNSKGRYINPRTFSKEYSVFLGKINFPKKIRFHDLRHANATLMLASGVPAKVASKRLGHSKISTTLDIYTDVLKEVEINVADKLENILYNSK